MTKSQPNTLATVADLGFQTCKLRPTRPWREIGYALLILFSSVLLGSLIWFATNIVLWKLQGWPTKTLNPTFLLLLASVPTGLICTWMVVARARYLGAGHLAESLAMVPMKRSSLFAFSIAMQVGATIFYVVLIMFRSGYSHSIQNDLNHNLIAATGAGPILLLIYLINLVILQPVMEELFFRGWLWTELSRAWDVQSTAVCTGLFWWILHLGYFGAHGGPYILFNAIVLRVRPRSFHCPA